MKKQMTKKGWIALAAAGSALVVMAAVLTGWLLLRGKGQDPDAPPPDWGIYTGYSHIVVAKDTPEAVLAELSGYGVTPVVYKKDSTLYSPNSGGLLTDVTAKSKIYLCEGTYTLENGLFLELNESLPLTVTGAGIDKTKIVGGGSLRDNNAPAILLRSSGSTAVDGAVIENLSVSGFEYGVRVENGRNIRIQSVAMTENHFVGLSLENARDCTITGCELSMNGNPEGSNTGYGLSLLYDSTGNKGEGNLYKNNANANAIDFLERGETEQPVGNSLTFQMEYTLERTDVPVVDPSKREPGEDTLRFEFENGTVDGKGAVKSTSTAKVEKYAGQGYIFLFNTTIKLTVDVPKAGQYRVYVVGASDDGNNKCDYIQINEGTKYLTSFLGKNKGKWQLSQPGTEKWENDELHPQTPTDGFTFKEGQNEILITANWGYCMYDSIILEPVP